MSEPRFETAPAEVTAAWGWSDAAVRRLTGGLINLTLAIERDGAPLAVLQRLHPVFGPAVNLDIEAVTEHLAAHGLATPRLVRTPRGAAWVEHDGAIWRALSWVDGQTVHAVPAPAWARAGGELVGRFHRAVADLDHVYHFARAGVHDTPAHLARLADRLARAVASPIADAPGEASSDAVELGREILAAAGQLPAMPALPLRHSHGDLKISNILFDAAPPPAAPAAAPGARALVDLDTLGHQTLAFELGDAMRSWCNPRGEDAAVVGFDLDIFAAAIAGWSDVVGPRFDRAERAAIVTGLETVCVELAARFAVDVFDDSYFGWDPTRFSSRREHNLVRARGQLTLARAVGTARRDALDLALART